MRNKLLLLICLVLLTAALPAPAGAQGPERLRQQAADEAAARDAFDPVDGGYQLHDHQHGAEDGHLPGTQKNVRLVGRADIRGAAPGRVADVAAAGNFAYLTVRDPVNCTGEEAAGVAIFKIANPWRPRQIGFIEATQGSQPGEGAQVVRLHTRAFKGRVLITNNEICGAGGEGGMSLYDVRNPWRPRVLTAHFGDDDFAHPDFNVFNEYHSAFAWQQGDRAFAVGTDNYESGSTDVDIFEITDPRNPVLVTELAPNAEGVLQEQDTPLGEASFLHDMVVQKVRGTWILLLSYWDGGWVLYDVDDPANPRFMRDSDYPAPDTLTGLTPSEGNAHQAEFGPYGRFIVGTDEDFSPYRVDFAITSGPHAGEYRAGEFGFTVPLVEAFPDGQFEGPTIYGGLGCPSNDEYGDQPAVPDASDLPAAPGEAKVVVLLRGLCFFSEKIEQAQEAGYDVVIIANHHTGAQGGAAPDASLCGSQGHEFTPTIPAICLGHRAFHLLFGQEPTYAGADEPAIGTLGESVSASAVFDGWGYVRLLESRTMEEVDAYAIPEALDPAYASGFGDLSVHEVAVDRRQPGLAYLSYYAGGLRVIRFNRNGLREVGRYIHRDGNNFWGVEYHRLHGKPLILASDRDSGLWIFRFRYGR